MYALTHSTVSSYLLVQYAQQAGKLKVVADMMKPLVTDLCTSLKSLANTQRRWLTDESLEGCATKLLKAIVNASTFILDFVKNLNGISSSVHVAPPFPGKLEGYQNDLMDLREALLINLLIEFGTLGA